MGMLPLYTGLNLHYRLAICNRNRWLLIIYLIFYPCILCRGFYLTKVCPCCLTCSFTDPSITISPWVSFLLLTRSLIIRSICGSSLMVS